MLLLLLRDLLDQVVLLVVQELLVQMGRMVLQVQPVRVVFKVD